MFLVRGGCVYVSESVHVSAVPLEAREVVTATGVIVTGGCELPDVGAGN